MSCALDRKNDGGIMEISSQSTIWLNPTFYGAVNISRIYDFVAFYEIIIDKTRHLWELMRRKTRVQLGGAGTKLKNEDSWYGISIK